MNKTYYFTYGQNHTDAQGVSLGNCYTPIEVSDADEDGGHHAARAMMADTRNDKWSSQYGGKDEFGIDKFGLVERSLESVRIDWREEYKSELIAMLTRSKREFLRVQLESLDKSEAILRKLSIPLLNKVSLYNDQVDLDGLTRDEVEIAFREIAAGKWERKPCTGTEATLDYIANVDGVLVRLYAAAPPGSCRIIEEEVVIPEQRTTRKKLVCHE